MFASRDPLRATMDTGSSFATLLVAALLTLAPLSSARPSAAESRGAHCCFPDQFNGRLSLSSTLDTCGGSHAPHGSSHGGAGGRDDTLLGFSFAVDYGLMRLYGEHVGRRGPGERLHHIEFVADLRDEARRITVRERRSNRCWTHPTGERTADRCVLDDALYRGDITLPPQHKGGPDPSARTGGLYVLRRPLDENSPPEVGGDGLERSLLLVAGDTCLPVIEMDSTDMDRYSGFRDMARGLGDFDGRRGASLMEPCLEPSLLDDLESLESSEEGDGGRGKRASGRGSGRGPVRSLIRMDIYLYLLKMFFPLRPPQPCCGPQQWQASIVKTISYTNVKTNYVGEAVTSVPHMYVDHVLGKMAANVVEYANNAQTSNTSFLATYGPQLSIYAVDWTNNQPSCSIFTVTDVDGPMRNSCMLPTAKYQKTVRIGGSGPLDSLRLQVWDNTLMSVAGTGLNFTGESYISPRDCMTVMEAYKWQSSNERVWGTVVLSNAQTSISNPAAVFAVPASCAGVTAYSVTSQQVKNALGLALSYAG